MKCNKELPVGSDFCQYCGNQIEKEITVQEEFEIPKNEFADREENKKILKNEYSKVDKGYKLLELKRWRKATELFESSIVSNQNVSKAYIGKLLAKFKLSDLESLASKSKNLNKYYDFKLAKNMQIMNTQVS